MDGKMPYTGDFQFPQPADARFGNRDASSEYPGLPSLQQNFPDFPTDDENSRMRSVIEQKEEELREIHAFRVKSLEQRLNEAVTELQEEKQANWKLKEDFTYNLKLLEERDSELERYDTSFKTLRTMLKDRDAEISELNMKVSDLESNLRQVQYTNSEQENYWTKRCDDLTAELDQERQDRDDQNRRHREELERSKSETVAAFRDKEATLEKQRREVTDSYEQLMKNRDDDFAEREDALRNGLNAAESKIRQIQSQSAEKDAQVRRLTQGIEELRATLREKETQAHAMTNEMEDAALALKSNWSEKLRAMEAQHEKVLELLRNEHNGRMHEMQRNVELLEQGKKDNLAALERVRLEAANERTNSENRCETLRDQLERERQEHMQARIQWESRVKELESSMAGVERLAVSEKNSASTLVEEKERQLSELKTLHAQLSSEHQQLRERVQEVEAARKEAEEKGAQHASEHLQLQNSHMTVVRELESLRNSIDIQGKSGMLNPRVLNSENYAAEIQRLQAELKVSEERRAQEWSDMQVMLERLRHQNEDMAQAAPTVVGQGGGSLLSVDAEVERLTRELERSKDLERRAIAREGEARNESERARAEVHRGQRDNERLKLQVDELNRQLLQKIQREEASSVAQSHSHSHSNSQSEHSGDLSWITGMPNPSHTTPPPSNPSSDGALALKERLLASMQTEMDALRTQNTKAAAENERLRQALGLMRESMEQLSAEQQASLQDGEGWMEEKRRLALSNEQLQKEVAALQSRLKVLHAKLITAENVNVMPLDSVSQPSRLPEGGSAVDVHGELEQLRQQKRQLTLQMTAAVDELAAWKERDALRVRREALQSNPSTQSTSHPPTHHSSANALLLKEAQHAAADWERKCMQAEAMLSQLQLQLQLQMTTEGTGWSENAKQKDDTPLTALQQHTAQMVPKLYAENAVWQKRAAHAESLLAEKSAEWDGMEQELERCERKRKQWQQRAGEAERRVADLKERLQMAIQDVKALSREREELRDVSNGLRADLKQWVTRASNPAGQAANQAAVPVQVQSPLQAQAPLPIQDDGGTAMGVSTSILSMSPPAHHHNHESSDFMLSGTRQKLDSIRQQLRQQNTQSVAPPIMQAASAHASSSRRRKEVAPNPKKLMVRNYNAMRQDA
jgi:hypothetical protein